MTRRKAALSRVIKLRGGGTENRAKPDDVEQETDDMPSPEINTTAPSVPLELLYTGVADYELDAKPTIWRADGRRPAYFDWESRLDHDATNRQQRRVRAV